MVRRSTRRLDSFLESLAVRGHLGACLSAHEDGNEQSADPMTFEVDRDRHARSGAVGERLDGDLDDGPDRAIDPSDGPTSRRCELRHSDVTTRSAPPMQRLVVHVRPTPRDPSPSLHPLTTPACHSANVEGSVA